VHAGYAVVDDGTGAVRCGGKVNIGKMPLHAHYLHEGAADDEDDMMFVFEKVIMK